VDLIVAVQAAGILLTILLTGRAEPVATGGLGGRLGRAAGLVHRPGWVSCEVWNVTWSPHNPEVAGSNPVPATSGGSGASAVCSSRCRSALGTYGRAPKSGRSTGSLAVDRVSRAPLPVGVEPRWTRLRLIGAALAAGWSRLVGTWLTV
jgi:hypothetical protein